MCIALYYGTSKQLEPPFSIKVQYCFNAEHFKYFNTFFFDFTFLEKLKHVKISLMNFI